jgi:hypothetical protein
MIRTDVDFIKFALKNYDNPLTSSIEEFDDDVKIITYINNLLNRYRADSTDLKSRLIINHIVILGNCFTVMGATQMLQYKVSKENAHILNTFLFYMERIEKSIIGLNFELLRTLQEDD